jgi:hypothetical protein
LAVESLSARQRRRQPPASDRILSRPLAVTLARVLLAAVIVVTGFRMLDDYDGVLRLPFRHGVPRLGGSDFPAFYAGATLATRHPSQAYDGDRQGRETARVLGLDPDSEESTSPWFRYYNPPFYSLLLSPLTLIPVKVAFVLTWGINALGLALLLRVLYRILQPNPGVFPWFAAGLLTSIPVQYAFWHAQPTLFLAALCGLTFLAAEAGDAKRTGLFWALLSVKLHWLLAPALVLWRSPRRVWAWLATGLAVLALLSAWVGPHAAIDYVRLVAGRGQGDIRDASFAEAVLSWSGFFRALDRVPDPLGWLIMSTITLALFAFISRRGDRELLPLGAALVVLLVVPHSHPQDWILLAPGAAYLLRRRFSPTHLAITVALLVFIYLGLENWAGLSRRDQTVYWPTLAGFSMLAWLAVLSVLPSFTIAGASPAAAAPESSRLGAA